MRIAVFGESLSDNVGDQAIAAGMASLLARNPHVSSFSMHDLSLRNRRGPRSRLRARGVSTVLPMLSPMRNAAAWLLRDRSRQQEAWGAILHDSDAVIIGGGQLLMDNALSFPLKLTSLIQLCRRQRVPYAFFSCGVGRTRFGVGRHLLTNAVRGAEAVTVRDRRSVARAMRLALPTQDVRLAPDPALWCGDVVPARTSTPVGGRGPRVGLCIMAPSEIARRSSVTITHRGVIEFWLGVVRALSTHGFRVALFTTGSSPDHEAMREVAAESNGAVAYARPKDVADVCRYIADSDAIVAHRLHASVLSFSLLKPSVGLDWDDKVHAFYALCERSEYALPVQARAETIVERIEASIQDPPKLTVLSRLRQQTMDELTRVIGELKASAAGKPS